MRVPFLRTTLAATICLGAMTLAVACEPQRTLDAGTTPQTSRMLMSQDGETLYVALADHDLVRAIDARTGAQRGEVAVVGHPHRITLLSDGRVAVSARYAGQVSIVNVERGRTDSTVDVGSVGECAGSVLGRNFPGSTGLCVHDADQIDARHVCQQPGVMLAEVTDTDDGDA